MRLRTSVVAAGALLALLSGQRVARAQAEAPTLRVDLGSGVSLEMVLVKAGAFRQGSPASEAGRADDETSRDVTLTRDYYIGVHEVTVGQFARFVSETGYKTEAEKGTSGGFGWNGRELEQRAAFNWRNPGFVQTDLHPVSIVTFDDASAFTRWLSKRTGRTVSLPTEAQWEFAARANSTSAYPSADKAAPPGALGWSRTNAGGGTHRVGEKAPNGIGLFDLAGNVAEWCLDWYGPYESAAVSDPMETRDNRSDKPRRVLRGGSWLRDPKNGRSAARYRSTPGSRNADNGFRIVASTTMSPVPAPSSASTATSAASQGEGSWLSSGLGLLAGILAVGLGFLYLLWRMLIRFVLGKTAAAVDTKITPDGFTIKAPRVPTGHRLHYRYQVDGEWKTGSVLFSGDPDMGQTVYTGARPSSAIVFAVTAPGEALPVEKPVPVPRSDDHVSRGHDDDSFRGYPSAYR
jgi:sulfatase modifying factor 1